MDQPYDVFAIQRAGQVRPSEYPTLNTDLTIRLEPIDGHVLGPFTASSAILCVHDPRINSLRAATGVMDAKIDCVATESRFALVCTYYAGGKRYRGLASDPITNVFALFATEVSKSRARRDIAGTALAGQLRYPWIGGIIAMPREHSLHLFYLSAGHKFALRLIFGKKVDVEWLGYTIKQRVITYHLVDRFAKDAATDAALRHALAAPAIPLPSGKGLDFDIPVKYQPGPHEHYAPTAAPSVLWAARRPTPPAGPPWPPPPQRR